MDDIDLGRFMAQFLNNLLIHPHCAAAAGTKLGRGRFDDPYFAAKVLRKFKALFATHAARFFF
ncbi:hypothetical protein [Thalassorhabdomicrobium marinisediminis]|uniref:hypothetical protein n=1 Tax=Thalassorhabdomicrobium marinisediminis TaxID=2170577 RepID=UPI000D3EA7F1|nr:hypothetical protein [Thalassorhabdomicrobium marinisediminis]